MHFSFVILHYKTIQLTVNCINSIQSNFSNNDIDIIVVDNGSKDGTGEILLEKYKNQKQIHVLILDSNQGFARGNNIGFRFVKENICTDYVIFINNDTLFDDRFFLEKLHLSSDQNSADILGPDIVTLDGEHQNPFRAKPLTVFQIKKKIIIRYLYLSYFFLKKKIKLFRKINVLEDRFEKISKKNRNRINNDKICKHVVLQGACIIFNKKYLINENFAFCPDTFMYGEEDLLFQYADKKKYIIIYDPNLKIIHLDGKTTGYTHEKSLEKNIFFFKNSLAALKILLKKMKEGK